MKRVSRYGLTLLTLLLISCTDPKREFTKHFPDIRTEYEVERHWSSRGIDSYHVWRVKIENGPQFLSQLQGFEKRTGETGCATASDPSWWPSASARAAMRAYYRRTGPFQIIWHDGVADRYYFTWYDM